MDSDVVEQVRFSPFGEERIDRQRAQHEGKARAKEAKAQGTHVTTGNTQVFGESTEADHPATEAYEDSDLRLHGDRRPNLAISHEKPEHRVILYLKAQGMSNKEVADRTGYTQPWISQVVRQPWFKIRLLEELRTAGLDEVQTVLKGTTLDCVMNLIEIAQGNVAGAKVSDIRAANDSLIDRVLGKPKQTVDVNETRRSENVAAIESEIENKERRLAQIREARGKANLS